MQNFAPELLHLLCTSCVKPIWPCWPMFAKNFTRHVRFDLCERDVVVEAAPSSTLKGSWRRQKGGATANGEWAVAGEPGASLLLCKNTTTLSMIAPKAKVGPAQCKGQA